MAYRPIEPVGLGRNVAAEMAKGAPRLQQEMNTMGPDTIKMIALQQIAEQEKQRANNANLQAQPNPMTVLQQVEQEVMQMRQPQQPMIMPGMRDRAAQVGGVLAQKQRMEQQNMRRAAQPQQRPPVQAAMGGLMTRPAPNIQARYFEGGGIVGFQKGDKVEGGVDADELKRYGLTYEQFAELPAEKQQEIVRQINSIRTQKGDLSKLARAGTGILDLAKTPITALRNVAEEARTSDIGKALGLATPFEEAERVPYFGLTEAANRGIAAGARKATPAGILSQLPKADEGVEVEEKVEEKVAVAPTSAPAPVGGAPAKEKVEKERVFEEVAFKPMEIPDSLKQAGQKPDLSELQKGIAALRGSDPTTARDTAAEFYKKQMALDPELAAQQKGIAAEIKRRYEEPETTSRLRGLREMFAAGANKGSLGSIGAGMSEALSNIQDTERARKEKNFEAYQNSVDKLVAQSNEIASGALEYGKDAEKEARQNIRTALNTSLGVYQSESADARAARNQEAQLVINNANNEVRTAVGNLDAKVTQQANDALNKFREESLVADDVKSQRQLLGTLVKAKQSAELAIQSAIADLTVQIGYTPPPEDYEGTPEEYRKEVIDAALSKMAASLGPLNAMIDEFGGNLGVDLSTPEPEEQGDPRADAIVGI